MLCVPGQLYLIPHLILQNTNCEEMQIDILAFQALPYLYAALSRNDLSYVAGEFRIFGAIFLEDGCSLFECHINLSELGKILFCEVFNFVGDRFLLNKGGLQRFLKTAEALGFVGGRPLLDNILLGGLDGLGFTGDWLFGDWFGWHGKKDICPIEAEATRKNHRHPIGAATARRKVVGMTISVAVASVNAKYRLFERNVITY